MTKSSFILKFLSQRHHPEKIVWNVYCRKRNECKINIKTAFRSFSGLWVAIIRSTSVPGNACKRKLGSRSVDANFQGRVGDLISRNVFTIQGCKTGIVMTVINDEMMDTDTGRYEVISRGCPAEVRHTTSTVLTVNNEYHELKGSANRRPLLFKITKPTSQCPRKCLFAK
jgi:hypothetical protein